MSYKIVVKPRDQKEALKEENKRTIRRKTWWDAQRKFEELSSSSLHRVLLYDSEGKLVDYN